MSGVCRLFLFIIIGSKLCFEANRDIETTKCTNMNNDELSKEICT